MQITPFIDRQARAVASGLNVDPAALLSDMELHVAQEMRDRVLGPKPAETDEQIAKHIRQLLLDHGIVQHRAEARPGVWGASPEWIEKMRALGMVDIGFAGVGRMQGDPPGTLLRLQDAEGRMRLFRLSVQSAEHLCATLAEFLAIYSESTRRQPDSSSGIPNSDVSPQDGHTPSPEDSA